MADQLPLNNRKDVGLVPSKGSESPSTKARQMGLDVLAAIERKEQREQSGEQKPSEQSIQAPGGLLHRRSKSSPAEMLRPRITITPDPQGYLTVPGLGLDSRAEVELFDTMVPLTEDAGRSTVDITRSESESNPVKPVDNLSSQGRNSSDNENDSDKFYTPGDIPSTPIAIDRSGASSPTLSDFNFDTRSDVSGINSEDVKSEINNILSEDIVKSLKVDLDGIFNKPIVNITLDDIKSCCTIVGEKLGQRAKTYPALMELYDRMRRKDHVIEALKSLIEKDANKWNRDDKSKEAVLESMRDEKIREAFKEIKEKFGSSSFNGIIDRIREINPHINVELKNSKHINEEIPAIFKSELEIGLETEVRRREEALRHFDDTGIQESASQDIIDDINSLTLGEGLKIQRDQMRTGMLKMADGIIEITEGLASAIKSISNISDVKSGYESAGSIAKDTQKGFRGVRETNDGLTLISKELRRKARDLKMHISNLRNSRRTFKQGAINPEFARSIIMPGIILAEPFLDPIYAKNKAEQARKSGGREKLQKRIEEAKDSLVAEREKSKFVNLMTSLLAKAITAKVRTDSQELVGRIADIPDRKMPAFWREVRNLVSNFLKDVPDGLRDSRSLQVRNLFEDLWGEMKIQQQLEWSASRLTDQVRHTFGTATTFSSDNRYNSRFDAQGALTMKNNAEGRMRSLEGQSTDSILYSNGNSSGSDAEDIAGYRAIMTIKSNRRKMNLSDNKVKTQLAICREVCEKEAEIRFCVQDCITEIVRDILANSIVMARAQFEYYKHSDRRRAIEEIYCDNSDKNNYESLLQISRIEAAETKFLATLSMANEQRILDNIGFNKFQDIKNKVDAFQRNITDILSKYPPTSGDTYISEIGELVEKATKTVPAIVALAGMGV